MVYIARWQIFLVLAVCVFGLIFAAPNVLERKTAEDLPGWLPHKQISLGLDLQGGSHLLLEVEVEEVIEEQLTTLTDSVRSGLRQARIGYTSLGTEGTSVVFQVRDLTELERTREVVEEIAGEFGGGIGLVRGIVTSAGREVEATVSDDGSAILTFTEKSIKNRQQRAIEQSIEIVRRRIDETGTREPTIQRQGANRILVQLPGVGDPERVKRLLGKTAKLTFHLLDPTTTVAQARRGQLPPGSMLLPGDDVDAAGQPTIEYVVRRRVEVGGDRLIDAQPTFDQNNQPVVSFRFDTVGGRKFGDATKENVGQRLAIVLDGQVISAPVIREPILGGSGQISGNFTVSSAQDLALLLRAGALPAPLVILEERTVGPDLGADSIKAGKIASILGLTLVVVFMAAVYGLFGLMASIALLLNLMLIAAVLSILQATLTLPGIAGIVLTIGMAVDANVLIFERIREEVRGGRTPISAIDAGYKRALTTIIDSNLTTLIAAVLLFMFGSGPIKGFAVTLSIGLVTSMFTAMMVTRLMIVTWLRQRRPQALPI
jgi:preprotein translocase subunit SecD